jgi:hypothetical protein
MICCLKFRPYSGNTLRGFCDLELSRVGVVICECCWHEKAGKEWVSFPTRSFRANDGKTQWSSLVHFAEGARQARDEFQRQALEAIRAVAGVVVTRSVETKNG